MIDARPCSRIIGRALTLGSRPHTTPDNDPDGEHDFGVIDFDGNRVFWKVDLRDQPMQYGSQDPASPAVRTRFMAIMLAGCIAAVLCRWRVSVGADQTRRQ